MNQIKAKIEEKLGTENGNSQEVEELIKEYENICPYDIDLYAMKIIFYLNCCNLDKAKEIAETAVQKNPYHAEANYNLAIVCEMQKEYKDAFRYYVIASELASASKSDNTELSVQNIREYTRKIRMNIELEIEGARGEIKEKYIEEKEWIKKKCNNYFGLIDESFWAKTNVIGEIYEDAYYNKRYVAWYERIGIQLLRDMAYNAVEEKVELRKAEEKEMIELNEECEFLLPIASGVPNLYSFQIENKVYEIIQNQINHFNYYRIPKKVKICAKEKAYFGEPILLKQYKQNKKLVLTIFVDGLSQKLLTEKGLQKLMPYTAKFFSKGVVCTNTFSTADWTYPSLATYMTGLDMTNHMIIGSNILMSVPRNRTLLGEYFQKNNYTTAKIDGDWRSTPVYGYSRGMDRIIYQHQNVGMKLEQVIPDVLEHIEFMKETNQFVYMGIGDLHDVADGFDLPASLQSKLSIEDRTIKEKGATSVKQNYEENKIKGYEQVITRIDSYLNIIYQYIEENYKEDEIVVSLFADHGQGYLVKPEEHFMSRGRSNVAFMFRGGNIEKSGICTELISTCDYLPIICKLANITLEDKKIDGRLPKYFGGDKEREYVISESIHPKDPYYASLFTKDSIFYVTSKENASLDGRYEEDNFKWENGSLEWNIVDWKEQKKEAEEKEIEKYKNIIMEHIAGNIIYS